MLYFYEYIIVNDLIRYKLLNMFGDTKHYNTKDYTHDEHLLKMLGSSLGDINSKVYPLFLHTKGLYFNLPIDDKNIFQEDLHWCITKEHETISKTICLAKTENYEIIQSIKDTDLCYIHHKEGYLKNNAESYTKRNESFYCKEFCSHKGREIKSINDNPSNEYVILNDPIYSTLFTLDDNIMEKKYDLERVAHKCFSSISGIQDAVVGVSCIAKPNTDANGNVDLSTTDIMFEKGDIYMIEQNFERTKLHKKSICLYVMLIGAIHEICLHFFNNFLYYNIDMLKYTSNWITNDTQEITNRIAVNEELMKTDERLIGIMKDNSINEYINDAINAPMVTRNILKSELDNIVKQLENDKQPNISEAIENACISINKAYSKLRKLSLYFLRHKPIINEDITIYKELSKHCYIIIRRLLYKKDNEMIKYDAFDAKAYIKEHVIDSYKHLKKYIKRLDRKIFNSYIDWYNSKTQQSVSGGNIYKRMIGGAPTEHELGKNILKYVNKFGNSTFKDFQEKIVKTKKSINDIKSESICGARTIAFDREFGTFVTTNKNFAKEFANYHSYLIYLFNLYFINNFVPRSLKALLYCYDTTNDTVYVKRFDHNNILPYNYLYSNIVKQTVYNHDIKLSDIIIEKAMFIFELFMTYNEVFNKFANKQY